MKRTDLIAQNLVADDEKTIGEVMLMITDNQRGAVIVVDEEFIYKGVVSDGDIRRGLVRGATQLAPVSKIVNMNAQTLTEKDRGEAELVFTQQPAITLIPIVGEKNILVDVIVRDGHIRKN